VALLVVVFQIGFALGLFLFPYSFAWFIGIMLLTRPIPAPTLLARNHTSVPCRTKGVFGALNYVE